MTPSLTLRCIPSLIWNENLVRTAQSIRSSVLTWKKRPQSRRVARLVPFQASHTLQKSNACFLIGKRPGMLQWVVLGLTYQRSGTSFQSTICVYCTRFCDPVNLHILEISPFGLIQFLSKRFARKRKARRNRDFCSYSQRERCSPLVAGL